MRIWDLPPEQLCRQHLLGEHRELHAIWTILTQGRKSPYAHHPETKRWVGKLPALKDRHDMLVDEFKRRGWPSGSNHQTPLKLPKNLKITRGSLIQDKFVNTPLEQVAWIKTKGCECKVR